MLENVWFGLWGLLWAVYLMLDGFSLGVGILLPFAARGEAMRARLHRTIAPFWDANEVWLVAAGGVTFAAFPGAYATIFSALYAPLMLVLFGLILRAAAVEFRSKWDHPVWRREWDFVLFASSLTTAFFLGVTFGNLFRGVPVDAEGVLRGGLASLLHPYALAGGLLFLALFAHHGALWLALKTDGELAARAGRLADRLCFASLALVAAFVALSFAWTPLFLNHLAHPALFLLPAASVAGLAGSFAARRAGAHWTAWGASCAGIALLAATGVAGMFPNLLRSTLDPSWNVTIPSAASSPFTLKLMLAVTLLLVPVIVAYQIWAYTVFRGKTLERGDY